MAISLVQAIGGAGATTTSETHTIGVTTAANDLILVSSTNGGANANGTTPSGTVVSTGGVSFSAMHSLNGGGTTTLTGVLWAGYATGNHSGQTITVAGLTDSCSSCALILSGVATSGAAIATNQVLNASGTNQLSALDAGGQAGCWLVLVLACDDNIASASLAATDPASLATNQVEHLSSGGNDTGNTMSGAAMSGTGSTGTITWTNTRGAGLYQIALGVLLKPAGGDQALSPAGPTATVTVGTPAFAQTVVHREVTRGRIGWTP